MECVSPWEFALKEGDKVKAFLLAKGSRGGIFGSDRFKVTDQTGSLVNHGGKIFALKMSDVHDPYALGCEDANPFLIGSSVKRPQATPFTKT